MHWPGKIAGGRVSNEPVVSMDVVPTVLDAVGIDLSQYEIDGTSLLGHVIEETSIPEGPIFWEIGGQTAVRRGRWKLVLNGQLVEQDDPISEVHLSDLDTDPGEELNLSDVEPAVTAELRQLAEDWRAAIEKRWKLEYAEPNEEERTYRMV